MRSIYRLLTSLWTLEAVILLAVGICLAGSIALPSNLAFFSGIDETPLLQWLADAGRPGLTWWIYALIATMGLMGLCTGLCTIDALIKAWGRKDFMHRLYPQLMHIGVIFVLIGYLLTAWMGARHDVLLKQGQSAQLEDGTSIRLASVGSGTDRIGYYEGWEAQLVLSKDGMEMGSKTLRPVHPVYVGQTGLFFKSITLSQGTGQQGQQPAPPSALIRVCRDPGAQWALIGGVLVLAGGVGLLSPRRT